MAKNLKCGPKVPKTANLVCNAIDALDGASLSQITNYVAADKGISALSVVRNVKLAVKKGLDTGIIKRKNGVYMLQNAREIDELMVTHKRRRSKAKAGKSPKRRRSHAKRSVKRGKSPKRRRSVKRRAVKSVKRRSVKSVKRRAVKSVKRRSVKKVKARKTVKRSVKRRVAKRSGGGRRRHSVGSENEDPSVCDDELEVEED